MVRASGWSGTSGPRKSASSALSNGSKPTAAGSCSPRWVAVSSEEGLRCVRGVISAGAEKVGTLRVVVSEFMSLDGVVQAPGSPEEDPSGGFRHGGWSLPLFDPDLMGAVMNGFAERNEVLLQGRRTYQVSAGAWPQRSGDPFADWINRAQKYVVSDTLSDADLTWKPTTIIRGADLIGQVSALRKQPGGDIYVYGSLSVARSLLTAGLVDELVLMIEPITLGGGKTLFPTDGEARGFELVSAHTAATGVQVCRYRPLP